MSSRVQQFVPVRREGSAIIAKDRYSTLNITNDQSYGVYWDGVASACVRTGALVGVAASTTLDDALLPIQSAMKRCVMDDAGNVVYYLDPTNSYNRLGFSPSITGTDDVGTASKVSDVGVFTLDDDAYIGKYLHNTTEDTYSPITAKDSDDVLTLADDIMTVDDEFEICTAGIAYGGDGQVMVEVPAFYYRFMVNSLGKPQWDISFEPFEGASIHYAWQKNGKFVPYRYFSAYEGSMYDFSAGTMVPSANIIDAYTITSGDKLCSLSGQFPKTNGTRAEFRVMASMRGNGWRQLDYDLASAIQLLYLVEYADFDSQAMIGEGRTGLSDGTFVADSYIGKCGKSNLDGNTTGNVGGNTNAAYMSYRGIENFYGNVWQWLDGFNVCEHVPFVSNDDSDWQDDTSEGYTDLSVTMPSTNNYQQTLHTQDRGFLPATVGAATTKITDHYYQSTGWRVAMLGGNASSSADAGAFSLAVVDTSSTDYVSISGRISFCGDYK